MTMAKPDVTDPFGLLRPETWDDPYPTFARMRAVEPIHFSEAWGGWMLTRYQDVLAATRDPRLSSRRSSTYAQRLPPEVREKLAPLVRNLASWALINDPPEHNRLRSLINKAFTPRQVERLRPRIQELVDELLDAVQGTGRMDVTAQLSNPLPVIV
ncbi:MAG TPA: cytochrome P450, partial [Archangium sp.]